MGKCCTFNKCLCCIDLKIGSIAIGYLQLVMNFIGVIVGVYYIIQAQTQIIDLTTDFIDHPHTVENHHESIKFVSSATEILCKYFVSYSLIVIVLAAIGFDACLLYGIYKDKSTYIKSYMIFMTIFNGAFIVLWAISFAVPSMGLAVYIILPVIFVLYTYFLLVIRSYYCSMDIDYENTVPVKYSNNI